LAFVATVFSYELIYYGSRPLSGAIGSYCLMASLAISLQEPIWKRSFILGGLAALCVATRIQLAPVVAVVVVMWWWNARPKFVVPLLVGVAGIVLFAGALDAWTWGSAFVSYYNNVLFNVAHGVSHIFGEEPVWWYARALVQTSLGVMLLATIWVIANPRRVGVLWPCILALLIPHTLLAHKEYRFIMLLTPFVLSGAAILVSERISRGAVRRPVLVVGTLVLCTVNLFGLLHMLPGQRQVIVKPSSRHLDAREADVYLAGLPDVSGVLNLVEYWALSGGYYYLHRDVPFYYRRRYRVDEALAAAAPNLPNVSHVMVQSSVDLGQSDFEVVEEFGSVTLLARRADAASVRPDPDFSEHVLQRGVDDRFEPAVRPRY
jgi:phosphatidylinositol glycan class B